MLVLLIANYSAMSNIARKLLYNEQCTKSELVRSSFEFNSTIKQSQVQGLMGMTRLTSANQTGGERCDGDGVGGAVKRNVGIFFSRSGQGVSGQVREGVVGQIKGSLLWQERI